MGIRRLTLLFGLALGAVTLVTQTAAAATLTKVSLYRSWGPDSGLNEPTAPIRSPELDNGSYRDFVVVPFSYGGNNERYVTRRVNLGAVHAGEAFSVSAELQLTNDLERQTTTWPDQRWVSDVSYHARLTYSTDGGSSGGIEITEEGGEYVLPDVHHWMSQLSGTFKAGQDYDQLWVKLEVYAAAPPSFAYGDTCLQPYAFANRVRCGLDVDYPRGHLSVTRFSEAATAPPQANYFTVGNSSGSSDPPNPTTQYDQRISPQSRSFKSVFSRPLGVLKAGDIVDLSLKLQVDGGGITRPVIGCTGAIAGRLYVSPDPTNYAASGSRVLDFDGSGYRGSEGGFNLDGLENVSHTIPSPVNQYSDERRGTSMLDRSVLTRTLTYQLEDTYADTRPMYIVVRSDWLGGSRCDAAYPAPLIDQSRSYMRTTILQKHPSPWFGGETFNTGDSSERVSSLDGTTRAPAAVYSLRIPNANAAETLFGSAMARVSTSYYEVVPISHVNVDTYVGSIGGRALKPKNYTELNPYEYSYHLNEPFDWRPTHEESGDQYLSLVMNAELGGTWLGAPPHGLVPVRPDDGRLSAVRLYNAAPWYLKQPGGYASTNPIITGTVLTADPGIWIGRPTPSVSTRWQRCDSAITTCTTIVTGTPTYTVTAADVGKRIRYGETGTNTHTSRNKWKTFDTVS